MRLYPSIRADTFLEACGMADLVATCYGGRNRLVAEEFAKAWLVSLSAGSKLFVHTCMSDVHILSGSMSTPAAGGPGDGGAQGHCCCKYVPASSMQYTVYACLQDVFFQPISETMWFVCCLQAGAPETFDALEARLLGGQKLQGVITCEEVFEILKMRGWEQVWEGCMYRGSEHLLPQEGRYLHCIWFCSHPTVV